MAKVSLYNLASTPLQNEGQNYTLIREFQNIPRKDLFQSVLIDFGIIYGVNGRGYFLFVWGDVPYLCRRAKVIVG